jgi:hypothetical protein
MIPGNPSTVFIKYMAATITLENPQYIDWQYVVALQPKELLDYLINSRTKQMVFLSNRML